MRVMRAANVERGGQAAFERAQPFEGGRHLRRVMKIAAIERGEDPSRVTVSV